MPDSMRRMFNAGPAVDVSIVIATHNGEAYLGELLKTLRSQEAPFGSEILAFDMGSTDKTVSLLRSSGVRVYQVEKGKPFWRQAVKTADGRAVVFLSQDTLPLDAGWLHSLATPVLDDPALGIACGRLIADASVPPYQRGLITARPYLSGKAGIRYESADQEAALVMPCTNCALCRHAWRKAGEPDRPGPEFARSVLAAGFQRAYFPKAAAVVRSGEVVGECLMSGVRSPAEESGPLFGTLVGRLTKLGEELVALNEKGDLATGERGEAYAVSFALHGARMVEILFAHAGSLRVAERLVSKAGAATPGWLLGPVRNLRSRMG